MPISGQEHKLIEQLRKCRLRATGQRLAIMHVLMESRSHPSAEDIYHRLKKSHPTLSLSTVYKTLQVMANMGALVTIETGTSCQRFDGQMHPHHHAVCDKCGKVHDVDFDRHPIELNTKHILPGFNVQGVKVVFTGLCHNCDRTIESRRSSSPS
jgi:Fur family transcriptional regulator, peroxide stress response regulator